MNPDQTAPLNLIWVHIVCKVLKQRETERADDKFNVK